MTILVPAPDSAVAPVLVSVAPAEDADEGCARLFTDRNSPLWLAVGAIVERLVPGIDPYDRRQAVYDILHDVARALDGDL